MNKGYKDIIKNKRFRQLLMADLINRFGDSIDVVAQAWIIYELTNNAMWSAIIFGVNKIPSVFLAPLAGAWVEKKKKKTIMVVTDIIRGACVAIVATALLKELLNPWILMLTTIIISTAEAFRLPAGTAFIPKILDENELPYGMSLSSAFGTVMEVVGTVMAAGIIAFIGTSGAIYIDMVTFIVSACMISLIKNKNDEEPSSKTDAGQYLQSLKQGFSYFLSNGVIRFLAFFTAFLNGILVPLNSLQAPFAKEILNGGPEILAIISVTITIGMFSGALLYPSIIKKIKKENFIIAGGLCIGIYYVAVIIAEAAYSDMSFTYIYVSFLSLILGVLVSMLTTFLKVECIALVDEQYIARAASIMNAIGSAIMPITAFVVSIMASMMSTASIFVITGALDIVICLILGFSHAILRVFENTTKKEENKPA